MFLTLLFQLYSIHNYQQFLEALLLDDIQNLNSCHRLLCHHLDLYHHHLSFSCIVVVDSYLGFSCCWIKEILLKPRSCFFPNCVKGFLSHSETKPLLCLIRPCTTWTTSPFLCLTLLLNADMALNSAPLVLSPHGSPS